MITDKQVCIACAAYDSIDVAHSQLAAMRKALEAYEQSKPKPETVGYIYPSSYAKALRNESSCKMFVVPVTNLDTGEESSIPLYTTPPTREPLSEGEINNIVFSLSKGSTLFDFARLVEQAHGIGTSHEPT